MHLIINATQPRKTIVALSQKGNIVAEKTWQKKFHQSEKLLPAIDKILKQSKTKIVNLKGVVVVTGPGSFSAVRVGVAVANALSYTLKIPIIGIKLTEFKNLKDLVKVGESKLKKQTKISRQNIIKPFYDQKPNITKSKNRVT